MTVVTVTANPAIDQTVWIPGFRAGEVNRVEREQLHAGGKGVNVAAFLAQFGEDVVATGFLGTPNAGLFERFFAREGIAHDFVAVDASTRTGVKVVDEEAGTTTDLNFPGFEVDSEQLAELVARVAAVTAPGRWVALAGSLPPGAPPTTYRQLVEVVHAAGGLAALDTSGPALAEALAAGPDLVKPNRAELEELTGRPLTTVDDLLAAAREFNTETVVVSLGGDGALFSRGDEAVFAAPPPVRVASTVGAGDAMVAGTIAGLTRGLPLAEVAALATAFSAVAIARVGPQLDAAAVQETARAVEVRPL